MADNPGEPQIAAALKALAPYAPGFAGAVLSLAFVEQLTLRGKAVCVAVGLASAMFAAPALSDLADLVWPGAMPRSVRSGIEFIVALCAMGCLPPLLAWLRKVAGDPFSLLKVRIGPFSAPAGGEKG